MRLILASLIVVMASPAFALKFSFNGEEITKIIDVYSKATNQRFVIDPGVRGKGTVTAADDVTNEEAFNLLSSMLALNGYAISKQGDTWVVLNARNIQRGLIEVVNTLPALKPERMVTYAITLKYMPVEQVNRELRILPSKDGEMSVFTKTNQIFISDWTSNLHRIDKILAELDRPVDAKIAKIVDAAEREGKARREANAKREREEGPMPRGPKGPKLPPPPGHDD